MRGNCISRVLNLTDSLYISHFCLPVLEDFDHSVAMTVTKPSCLSHFMQHLSILTTGKATAKRSLRCYCGNTPKGNYGFNISQMKEIINSPISSNVSLLHSSHHTSQVIIFNTHSLTFFGPLETVLIVSVCHLVLGR